MRVGVVLSCGIVMGNLWKRGRVRFWKWIWINDSMPCGISWIKWGSLVDHSDS